MKPEDQMRKALQQIHEEALDRYRNKDGVSPMWILERTQFALAHRDAQPAVAVNQRMRTALQEIANTVNYAQWYQETAEKALEDANHTEVALDKVAAVAVNEQMLEALRLCAKLKPHKFIKDAIAAAEAATGVADAITKAINTGRN